MAKPTDVKFFHSEMPNAPVLTPTPGALLGVLDACLINGWGLVAVDSIVVANGSATATISTGHSFVQDVVLLIAGATPAALNGEHRVLSTTTTTVVFDADGIADGAAAGAITIKLAPLGWNKPFSGTNLAVYRSSAPESLGCFLRVDDTGTSTARVVGYELMTDVDTGLGPFPTPSQVSGGAYWGKVNGSSGARRWFVIGDDKLFYYCSWPSAAATYGLQGMAFGDPVRYGSTDVWMTVLHGGANAAEVSLTSSTVGADVFAAGGTGWTPRSDTGLGGSVAAQKFSPWTYGSIYSGNSQYASGMQFPNPVDGALITTDVYLGSMTGTMRTGIRARYPGLLHIVQGINAGFDFLDRVQGAGLYAGRILLAIPSGPPNYQRIGAALFDITGPWRDG